MKKIGRKIIAGLLMLELAIIPAALAHAAPKDPKKAKKPPQPVSIEADELFINDRTGELFAQGKVVITQDKSRILSDLVRGNSKEMEVWTEDKARLIEPYTDVVGMRLRYNYGARMGTINDLKGKCGDDFISGKTARFEGGKITAFDVTTTGCPSKGTPDYRVTARKVEIWPEDKLIAYDANVWIQNVIIYTTPKYVKSLKKGEKDDEKPRYGYQDPDGFWVSQRFRYPFTETLSLITDLTYYTVKGFKPTFDLVNEQKDYTMHLSAGEFSSMSASSDPMFGGFKNVSNWVTKTPEFRFELHQRRLEKTPFQYHFNATLGNWTDSNKTSFHQNYLLYFTRDPIYLEKDKKNSWVWSNGFGVEHIRESYNESTQNLIRYNTSVSKTISPRLSVWTGFNYTNSDYSAFAYNSISVAQEWYSGIKIQLDKKTAFSYTHSYDITNGRTYENMYTLYRNLHCWEFYIQYQEKSQRWFWNITVVRF